MYRDLWSTRATSFPWETRQIQPGAAEPMCAVPTGGDDMLASGSRDGTVHLWNPRTRELVRTLPPPGPPDIVSAMVVTHRDGRPLLAVGLRNGPVTLWDPLSDTVIDRWDRFIGGIVALAVIQVDGRELVACAAGGGDVILHDPTTGERVRWFDVPSSVYRYEPAHDRIRAMCAATVNGLAGLGVIADDGTLSVWSPANQKVRHLRTDVPVLRGTTMCTVSVAGRDRLAVATTDLRIVVIDPTSGEITGSVSCYARTVAAVRVDGRDLLAAATADGVRLWHPGTLHAEGFLHSINDRDRSCATDDARSLCAVFVDGSVRLAVGGVDGPIRLFNRSRIRFSMHVVALTCVNVGSLPTVVAATADGSLRGYDLQSGAFHGDLLGVGPVLSLAPWGENVVAVGRAGQLWRWNPLTRHRERLFPAIDDAAWVGALGSDQTGVLVVARRGNVEAWSLTADTARPIDGLAESSCWATVRVGGLEMLIARGPSGRAVGWAPGADVTLPDIAIAPDSRIESVGDRFLALITQRSVRIIDVTDGREVQEIVTPGPIALASTASTDGRDVVITLGDDRVLRTWSATDGRELASVGIERAPRSMHAVGNLVVVGTDADLRVWQWG